MNERKWRSLALEPVLSEYDWGKSNGKKITKILWLIAKMIAKASFALMLLLFVYIVAFYCMR